MPKKSPLIFSLLDTPAFGGAEQYLLAHLFHLHAQGYSVYVATNNQQVFEEIEKRLYELESQPGQNFTLATAPYLLDAIGNWKGLVKYLLGVPAAVLWLLQTLKRLTKSHQVICLLPGFTDRLTFSPFIKLIFKLPLIWIDIAPLEPIYKQNWGFPRLLYNMARKFPDHVVVTSKWTRESITTTGGFAPQDVTLIYPGVKQWGTADVRTLRAHGKKELKRRGMDNSLFVGWVGRMASENQVELILKAFAQVGHDAKLKKPLKAPPRLILIGDGPERERYEGLARELDIQDRVFFTGFIDEMIKFSVLAACDAFVFTRSWELDGFGMTTIEAMSVGVPVVTPQFGPQKEIIADGKSGLHFETNSAESLAQKLTLLLSQPKLRKKLGAAGYKRVMSFAQPAFLKKMHRVVKKYS